MKKLFQRHQIMESLESLNSAQADQVLDYIRGLSTAEMTADRRKKTSRKEAMHQIRQALSDHVYRT